jgi:outer membrane cobalamin receptor
MSPIEIEPARSKTEVQVVVDGLLMNLGVETLRNIPAASVASIQILSAREGTTKYGATAGGGVIVVRTTAKGTPLPFSPPTLDP